MAQILPDIEQLWRAIELYLASAYEGPPPRPVQQRLDTLRRAGDAPWDSAVFERSTVGGGPRLSLRLGNRSYPHMKLSIDRTPDGAGSLFRADTHDQHLAAPAGSAEQPMIRSLVRENQRMAQSIENAWEAEGLPTFKTLLRDDLQRRARAAPPNA